MKLNKISVALLLVATFLSLFSCKSEKQNGKIKIVTTIFPEYDWVKNVVGENCENVELSLLMNNGVDLHSYQPPVKDTVKIAESDLFIYVGGESDEWVEDALESMKNSQKKKIVLDLVEILGENAKIEEEIEGMENEEHSEEHESAHHHDEDEDEEDCDEIDEHVWLSVKNAIVFVDAIKVSLCSLDSANEAKYKKNASEYKEKLLALDAQYQKVVNSSDKKILVFADRFPFRYFTDDYGLKYFAAFKGCSAETEASFKTVIFLAKKIDEQSLSCVCKIEKGDGKIAQTVKSNSKNKNLEVCTFDSMQSVTSKDIESETSYLSIMQNNLEVLQLALQ